MFFSEALSQGEGQTISGDIKPLRLYQNRERKGKHTFDTSSLHPPKSIILSENPTSQRLKLRTNEVTCKNSANNFYLWQSNLNFLTDNYFIYLEIQVCFI
jgi:hypothetical protein